MSTVGAVIGRFQVDNLHEGHRFIIGKALENHRKVIVFVGCAPFTGTKSNPLDYPTRERMIRKEFPDVTVLPLNDHPSDVEWSKSIDSAIRTIVPNVTKATLYGGRDSFVPHYHGAHNAIEVDAGISFLNGSELRSNIGKVVRGSADFRAGIIYAKQNEFPSVQVCVDICVWKEGEQVATAHRKGEENHPFPIHEKLILLGKKNHEAGWRFPGGKVDLEDETLEDAARRELFEETKITAEGRPLIYWGSARVNDYRIKPAKDGFAFHTTLFGLQHAFGAPQAGDDLHQTRWFTLAEATRVIIKDHEPLLNIATNKLTSKVP
jgi:bifunctional NMN adenylyltransferase/nudix hydrolase